VVLINRRSAWLETGQLTERRVQMKRWIWLLVLVALLVCGCAMHKHRESVREGALAPRLHRDAFVKEWGQPDRTTSTASQEFINFPSGGQSRDYGRARTPLQVWIYDKYGVALVFQGVRLVGWKTDKTPADLKALSSRSK